MHFDHGTGRLDGDGQGNGAVDRLVFCVGAVRSRGSLVHRNNLVLLRGALPKVVNWVGELRLSVPCLGVDNEEVHLRQLADEAR